ncbi:MAG: MBL fold metallo-hydrolase [Aristaeellaceae bacterium]
MLREYPFARISPGVYEIDEFDNASIYLVEGEERAALIDTGIGLGDLRAFAATLTDRPLTVLLTHNHRDHAGNAPLFPEVWLSELDQRMGPMIRPLTARESRMQYARNTCRRHPEKRYPWTEADMTEYPPAQEPLMRTLSDGDVIDLGGRTLRCVWTPGHTPGSMSFIDSRTGALFCGDSCNQIVGLGVRPIDGMRHATVEEAYAALTRLNAMDFDHRCIYNGHGDFRAPGKPLAPWVLSAVMSGMAQLLSGRYTAEHQVIPSINAPVEVLRADGVELQFHGELIHGRGMPFLR